MEGLAVTRLPIAALPSAAILALAAFLLVSPVLACQMVTASYYGAESGSRTADGSFFDGTQMVAAHKTMKFGTKLRVTYQGLSVVVTVRDRGPFIKGRSLDLSTAAARKLGMIRAGVDWVCVERVSWAAW